MEKSHEPDPKIIDSAHSGRFEKEGHHINVCIYKMEGTNEWSLEIVDSHGTSTVWGEMFLTDEDAWNAFIEVIEKEGITSLVPPIERMSFE